MGTKIDMTNFQINKLKVLYISDNRTASGCIKWVCQCKCGNICEVIADNLRTGNTQSCGKCNENSHGNIKIEQLLKDNNIPYIREKRFVDCKDKSYLPFDFYIDNKYCIEYDGKQHFSQDITFFNYLETHQHDIIKSQYCKENKIPLIRIPYTHYNKLCIEDLLLETSQFIEK